jgi:hypothetical protein
MALVSWTPRVRSGITEMRGISGTAETIVRHSPI